MANSSAGVFSALGGDIVVMVDIVPDPLTIASQLMEAAHNLEETTKPMLAAKRVAQEDIQAHFDSESDPGGTHWTGLSLEYAKYKESLGYPPDILHREGTLEAAATSDMAFSVTPHGLWFNWDAMPAAKSDGRNYAKAHQVGSGEYDRAEGETVGVGKNSVMNELGPGVGNALPARPFVGMSEAARETFVTIFDIWFDEAIKVIVHPSGRMQHREQSGRFGKNVKL